LVVAAVVYVVEATSQLVHVRSSATASGNTTVGQLAQMQVGTLRATALQVPTQSMERAAQAAGRGGAGSDAEQGARSASCWSWRCRCRHGAGSASRKPLVVPAVVYVAKTTSQSAHVPSSATASGNTPVAQLAEMQVGTLRVTALKRPTQSRERAAQSAGRGVAGADAKQGARSASGWSWRWWCPRGAGSASRRPLVVAAVVYVVQTTSQLVHVPSSATASGSTTVAKLA